MIIERNVDVNKMLIFPSLMGQALAFDPPRLKNEPGPAG